MTPLLPRGSEAIERYLGIVRAESGHRLGELAVRRGLLGPEDLNACLLLQTADPAWKGRPIGELLLERGHLKPDELAWLKREQERQEFVDSMRTGPPPTEGERTVGRFVLVQKIGEGGMGEVWRAWDPTLERWAAVKLLKSDQTGSARERLVREARSAARLHHPHIVPVYECGTEKDRPYIVMEFVDGSPATGTDKSVREILEIALAVAEALAYAHGEGLIHRDVKPGNILLDRNGKTFLVDFGLAREMDHSRKLTRTGAMVGTPCYMSPEQIDGDPRHIDALTDVYGLGATLYELLAGKPPFEGETPMQIVSSVLSDEPAPPSRLRRDVHPDAETICLKAMEKPKELRYGSAAEMAADLRRFLDGAPILARPAPLWRRIARKAKRHPIMGAVALVVTLLCVPLGVVAWRAMRDARHEREARAAEERRRVAFMRAAHELAPARSEIDTLDLMRARMPMSETEIAPYRRRAETAIDRALAAYPEFPEAFIERSRLLEVLGDRDGANRALGEACRLAPDSPRPRSERAKLTLRGLFADPDVVIRAILDIRFVSASEPVEPTLPLEPVLEDLRLAQRLATAAGAPLPAADVLIAEALQSTRPEDRDRLRRRLESAKAEGIDFSQMRMVGLAYGAAGDWETMVATLEPLADLRPRDAILRFAVGLGWAVSGMNRFARKEPQEGTKRLDSAASEFEAVLALTREPRTDPVGVCALTFLSQVWATLATAKADLGEDGLADFRRALGALDRIPPEIRQLPPNALTEWFVCEGIGRSPKAPIEERLDMLAQANHRADRIRSTVLEYPRIVVRRFRLFVVTAQLAQSEGRRETVEWCFRTAEEWTSALSPGLLGDPAVLLVRAHVLHARALFLQEPGAISRAEALVDEAFRKIPATDEEMLNQAYAARAGLRIQQGKYKEAVEDLRKIRTSDPRKAEAVQRQIRDLERLIAEGKPD